MPHVEHRRREALLQSSEGLIVEDMRVAIWGDFSWQSSEHSHKPAPDLVNDVVLALVKDEEDGFH